jgi:hypothetical protein
MKVANMTAMATIHGLTGVFMDGLGLRGLGLARYLVNTVGVTDIPGRSR